MVMRQQTQGPRRSECIDPRDYRVLPEFAEAPSDPIAREARAFTA